jgi:hypothetical protein
MRPSSQFREKPDGVLCVAFRAHRYDQAASTGVVGRTHDPFWVSPERRITQRLTRTQLVQHMCSNQRLGTTNCALALA